VGRGRFGSDIDQAVQLKTGQDMSETTRRQG